MSHPYRACRGCGIANSDARISKRGWCPTCAVDRATQAAAASVAAAARLDRPRRRSRKVTPRPTRRG